MQRNILLFLIFFSNPLFSQVQESRTVTHGNLIHINALQSEIDLTDTVGYWQDVKDYINVYSSSRSHYRDVLKFNNQNYYIKYTSISNFDESYFYEIESENGKTLHLGWGWDVSPPAVSDFRYFTTEYGMFFYHDSIYFIDTLFQKHSSFLNEEYYVLDMIGKINSSYLCIIVNDDTTRVGITDLSKLPVIDISNIQWIKYENYIHFFQQVDSNLFLIQSEELYLSKIHGDSILYLKSLEIHGTPFRFKYPYLYCDRGTYFKKYEYSNIDSSLTSVLDLNKGIPFGAKSIGLDDNLEFSIWVNNGSLVVYDMINKNIENSWPVSEFVLNKDILIDNLDIYLHNTINVTSIDNKNYQPKDFKLKTYPNPFNNNITIELSGQIPQHLELSIYNIRGQQVFSKRFNGKIHENKFKWNPINKSSSLYFVVVKTDFEFITKKIVYIK
jgi:hypothetical protein